MDIYWYIILFVLGAIIGSFLNVVIYRLHTGRSLSGRSHCMSCGKLLTWNELFPVISYLGLRGKCRGCGAYIPVRYFTVEVLTGFLFTLVWHTSAFDLVVLALNLILVSVCVVMLVHDIRHMIIPDELTYIIGAIAVVFLGYFSFRNHDALFAIPYLIAGGASTLFFWALWHLSKGRWVGFGDVKLAFPLGLMVGIEGVFSMIVFSFWIGAGVSVGLLALLHCLKRGQVRLRFLSSPLTIKSEVPFAPFFLAGFLLVHLFHADVFSLTYALFFN